jgi:hypothetical protein
MYVDYFTPKKHEVFFVCIGYWGSNAPPFVSDAIFLLPLATILGYPTIIEDEK